MTNTPLLINAEALLMSLADESIHVCVCSPPYWGLRVYTGAQSRVWGGDPKCVHAWDKVSVKFYKHEEPNKYAEADDQKPDVVESAYCTKCGAWLGALGLEPSVDQYVANMVEIGREIGRVLHPSGTWWLVIGDRYNGSGGAGGDYNKGGLREGQPRYPGSDVSGLKPKDLIGVPWRLAFALQADGWWLRNEIIWHKPNAMTENVDDRPTRAHESVFLLSKSHRYYYDIEATKVPAKYPGDNRGARTDSRRGTSMNSMSGRTGNMARLRDVWSINTRPYKGAHFAAYPPDLVEPCIKAGSSLFGVCSNCGAPYERITEKEPATSKECPKTQASHEARGGKGIPTGTVGKSGSGRVDGYSITVGWEPTCDCIWDCPAASEQFHWKENCPICTMEVPYPIVPARVLDPFNGTGTTLQVARALGRTGIGVDLSMEYLQQARKRLMFDKLDEWEHGKKDDDSDLADLPMFEEQEEEL